MKHTKITAHRGYSKNQEDLYDSISPDIDILVYTPEEFARSIANPAQGFWTEVLRDMMRVI